MPSNNSVIRVGFVSDVHYARRPPDDTRYYADSLLKLRSVVDVFNESDLDFIVELGDFKHMGKVPDRDKTLSFLDETEAVFKTFRGPLYHVLGNHDMDCISKADFLSHTENSGEAAGKARYSFFCKGIKFIALDANFNENGSPYDRGNFDWTKCIVPEEELRWLRNELDGAEKAVVFVHQMLDSFAMKEKEYFVINSDEVRNILEEKGNVLAVFQGHYHPGFISVRKGIQYFTIPGLIEGSYTGSQKKYTIAEIGNSVFLRRYYTI